MLSSHLGEGQVATLAASQDIFLVPRVGIAPTVYRLSADRMSNMLARDIWWEH